MVIRWSQKNLVLLTLAFPLLCLKGYADPSPPNTEHMKYLEDQFKKTKEAKLILEYWTKLDPKSRGEVLKKAYFQNNEVQISPDELKKQFDLQDNKDRKELLDKILKENSNKKDNAIQLDSDVIVDQYNRLDTPEKQKKFLNDRLKEHANKKDNAIKLDPNVLVDQYNKLDDKQTEFINDRLDPTTNNVKLTPEVFLDQYNKLVDPEKFLKDRLEEYEPSGRQDLINSLLEVLTNKELLQKLKPGDCKKVGENGNPTYIGATQVIDWLNTAHFKGFFQPTMTYALVNGDTFNDFDTFNQWNLWIEPFGFYTQFRRDIAPLKFNMYTAGISVGGEYTLFDRLVLGLGLAYSHSGVTWQDLHSPSEDKEKEPKKTSEDKRKKLHSTANLNSIYFGPSLSYVFSHGYLSCTIFGVANFYHVDRETNLFPDKILKPNKSTPEYNSWDIVGRLEGGLSYEVGGDFFLYPTAKVDYLHVIMPDSIETIDDDTELSIEALNGSFLNSKIGLKATRQFFYDSIGYLIPSLSAGLINFTPLSNNSYHYKIGECDKFEEKLKIGSWNQSYFGAGFAIVHKRGVLVSLDYELTVGADSPLHAGNLRAEWSW